MAYRRNSLLVVLCSWLAIAAGGAWWSWNQWQTSEPAVAANVKGATVDQVAGTVKAYPSFTGTGPTIAAEHYLLYDASSGRPVVSKSISGQAVPIASTTKVMTALVTLEAVGDLDELAVIEPESVAQPAMSSMMDIHTAERISVRNLLYGAMLVSGNDAAHALGVHVGRLLLNDQSASVEQSLQRFAQEMNRYAQTYSLTDTSFEEPIGLSERNVSTPLDLAKLLDVALRNEDLSRIVSTPLITLYDAKGTYRYDLRNSNRLVADYLYPGIIGGKTGFTNAAGHCLITAAERDGRRLIAIILHTNSEAPDASALAARQLLDWGFQSITWQ